MMLISFFGILVVDFSCCYFDWVMWCYIWVCEYVMCGDLF